MPRYRGATKFERQEYARKHFDFMANKYGKTTPRTFQGKTQQVFHSEENPELWREERVFEGPGGSKYAYGHKDFPTPYCGRENRYVEMRWFMNLLKNWPLDIKDILSSEFYGDACDREYVRGLLKLLDIYDYYTDGAIIIILEDGSMFQNFPALKTGEYDTKDLTKRYGSECLFRGDNKNRIRAEFVLEWLKDKEGEEANGATLYNERLFYDDTQGKLLDADEQAESKASNSIELSYGASGDESECDLVFTKLGWITAANKPVPGKKLSVSAVMGAVTVLRHYAYIKGTFDECVRGCGERYGFEFAKKKSRFKLVRTANGDIPEDFFTAAANTENHLKSGKDKSIAGGFFQGNGAWWRKMREKAANDRTDYEV